jgi:hypothetical protein
MQTPRHAQIESIILRHLEPAADRGLIPMTHLRRWITAPRRHAIAQDALQDADFFTRHRHPSWIGDAGNGACLPSGRSSSWNCASCRHLNQQKQSPTNHSYPSQHTPAHRSDPFSTTPHTTTNTYTVVRRLPPFLALRRRDARRLFGAMVLAWWDTHTATKRESHATNTQSGHKPQNATRSVHEIKTNYYPLILYPVNKEPDPFQPTFDCATPFNHHGNPRHDSTQLNTFQNATNSKNKTRHRLSDDSSNDEDTDNDVKNAFFSAPRFYHFLRFFQNVPLFCMR